MICVDGSFGEGGGQILRTALSLSLATSTPFRIDNIRAGRKNSGLLRQHLTAVLAAAQISEANVEGANLGSATLIFAPNRVRAGEYRFAVGTAGSATLIFQTLLPALLRADAPTQVAIEGGTHNPAAPPFDFLERAFVPLIRRMGASVSLKLERYGFYPAGGGRLIATVAPCAELKPLELGIRGEILSKRATAIVANLPNRIAVRELDKVAALITLSEEGTLVSTRESPGPGNIVLIEIETEAITEVFAAFGRLGVAAESVADEAVRQARGYLVSRAVAGEYLTDQLMLPLALAGSGAFTATKISRHARTNMEVISKFLPVRFAVEESKEFCSVRVEHA